MLSQTGTRPVDGHLSTIWRKVQLAGAPYNREPSPFRPKRLKSPVCFDSPAQVVTPKKKKEKEKRKHDDIPKPLATSPPLHSVEFELAVLQWSQTKRTHTHTHTHTLSLSAQRGVYPIPFPSQRPDRNAKHRAAGLTRTHLWLLSC